GALKSNIGHLESAAGIAGLVKAALCLEAEAIPPNLHVDRLNPHIDLDGARLQLPKTLTPWTRTGEAPLRAGVSAFGFGGTNAHVILEQAPRPAADPVAPREGPKLVVISAASEQALRARVEQWLTMPPQAELAAIAHAAGARSSHLRERLAVVAADSQALGRQLRAYLDGDGDGDG
ncbi:MAG: beta-ketoacyl synthase, partial [Candidatus Eremiobacteraeota bacterium]|nr:beta-ketoacyl synthase [Candidatus Eremiobacteraeota bacterium]